ncbi:hypothetical protein CU661_07815 [Pseudomonas syringae pv. actinidifoliorum]|nr:hypothetical protein [Pseudomonas syringae pv. actinidifoliorum]
MTGAAIRIAHEEAGTANEDLLINYSAFASKLAPTREHHPDALRRKSAPRGLLKIGRRASRAACDAECRTITR